MPTISTESVYRWNDNGTKMLVEEKRTETEVYWDMGKVITYTVVVVIIYFLMWVVKFALQLVVARKAFKIISVKGDYFKGFN